MNRKKHPRKKIEQILRYAEEKGWSIEKAEGKGHVWCRIKCPYGETNPNCRCGQYCINSVWSTPQNEDVHARQLKGKIDKCILLQEKGDEDL